MIRQLLRFAAAIVLMALAVPIPVSAATDAPLLGVLVYHRFGPTPKDSMTVRTPDFVQQLDAIGKAGVKIVPLTDVVDCFEKKEHCPDGPALAITIDDGHRSVIEEAFPIIRERKVPVTLFIYPSAISNASYALTWDEIREMMGSGLVTVQSHTVWHPNFKTEKKKQAPEDYAKFVDHQLTASKSVLEKKVATPIDILAWPFGIYDEELEAAAQKAGYRAAFTIDARPIATTDRPEALPRFMIVDSLRGKPFDAIVRRIAGKE
ncbi:MAG: polysaccharide deacetylase family protein [Hyphomicrobiales bacterium]